MLRQDSSAEVEYHAPSSRNPQQKKVRVIAGSKHKPMSDSSRTDVALDHKQHSDVTRGGDHKPAWNSNVQRRTAPVTRSYRNPSYDQRREQRKAERQRELMAQAAANERFVPRPRQFVIRERPQRNTETDERRVTQSEQSRPQRRQPPHQTILSQGQSG